MNTATNSIAPVVVGLDWERGNWRASYAGQPSVLMTRDELLEETFPGVDVIVVEQAHMQERNDHSVAQIYFAGELESMAARAKIKLFPSMPGQLAKAARAVGNVQKNDAGEPVLKPVQGTSYYTSVPDKTKDAETMSLYATLSPDRLRSWKPLRGIDESPSRHLWPARQQLRDDLRIALNPLRSAWAHKQTAERYALPEVDRFVRLLADNFDAIPEGVKQQFGISRVKKMVTAAGKPTKESKIGYGIRVKHMTAAMTVYLSAYTLDGDLRLNPDGGFTGVRFILDAIGMSSSYRPNMARSQLTHYGMRHYKGGRDGGFRSEYMRNLRHFLAFLRDADKLDGDSLTQDSVLDTLTLHSVPVKKLTAA
jgi:hypothetical protein